MMKPISLTRIAIVLIGALWLTSCTKNDTETIVPIGTEYYIDDILSVVSDSAFWVDFGAVNSGPVPPNVEGRYLVAPNIRVGTNVEGVPLGIAEPNIILTLSKQHNGIALMKLSQDIDNVTDTVFIMGSGNDFTVYFIEEKSYDVPIGDVCYHVRLKRGVVMKGTISEAGISNFRMATVVIEMEDDSQGLMPLYSPGEYYIYKDGDNLSQRIE
ncbi:MAG: hypothetical protein IKZ55_04255 [Bacteroidales bacterium]|nr:hypothetical protein [Bacteroidales bacterium]